MIHKSLHVFDFDGTLVDSPEPDPGKAKYKELTGIPWMIESTKAATENGLDPKFRRTGWWGRPESLLPPLLPRPIPPEFRMDAAYQGYLKAKENPTAWSVLLTGRHYKIGDLVKEILKELGIEFPEYYFKGMHPLVKHRNYPKDNNTPDYKLHVILDHLMCQDYTLVELWEDRKDIVDLFNSDLKQKIVERYPNVETLAVHDVLEGRAYFHSLRSGGSISLLDALMAKRMKKMAGKIGQPIHPFSAGHANQEWIDACKEATSDPSFAEARKNVLKMMNDAKNSDG